MIVHKVRPWLRDAEINEMLDHSGARWENGLSSFSRYLGNEDIVELMYFRCPFSDHCLHPKGIERAFELRRLVPAELDLVIADNIAHPDFCGKQQNAAIWNVNNRFNCATFHLLEDVRNIWIGTADTIHTNFWLAGRVETKKT
jgi:hypothetical protein